MPANRLAGETSPYLLQHAHNPVDWYPWGPEALERARSGDRPIFLSIGYAACHWCHVMERESFEDERTAAFLNQHFVAIKVDREERPDLDAVYMQAVQAMTGSGGWPMSVFLTPDGRPFFGGTYFPPQRRHGLPAFLDVLDAVVAAWRDRRPDLEASGTRLAEAIRATAQSEDSAAAGRQGAATSLGAAALEEAVATLRSSHDPMHGGWGGAPKFPQAAVIDFLLGRSATGDYDAARRMALLTLDQMAAGGIHDQVGGGFHRYATDAAWLVPHFEKMLYDNAQLARTYLRAYRLTGNTRYRDVVIDTLDYLQREMTLPDGGLASSQDADAGGVEGATYTWTQDELVAELGEAAPLAVAAFGVSRQGNWEGRSILVRAADTVELSGRFGITPDEVERRLTGAKAVLLAARSGHPQPERDDKVVVAWNGLALAAFAEAALLPGRTRDLRVAGRLADFLLANLRTRDGRLWHSWRAGRTSVGGFLDDYTHLADGLLALYEATFDERWFVAARELMDEVLTHFSDSHGGFYDVADDQEAPLTRPKRLEDGALPSGNAMAATVLQRLAALTGETRHEEAADAALRCALPYLGRWPTGFGHWLTALEAAVEGIDEIAIIGDPADPATLALVKVAVRLHPPRRAIAVSPRPRTSRIELLQSRFALNGRPTAFVCRSFACRQPVTEPQSLAAQLSAPAPTSEPGAPRAVSGDR